MLVKRRDIYILTTIVGVLIIILGSFFVLSLKKDALICSSTIGNNKQCGQLNPAGKNTYIVNGIVESKKKNGGSEIINFKTLNNQKKLVLIPITLPAPNVPFGVTQSKTINGIERDTRAIITAREFFDSINVNDEVRISFYVASQEEITLLKKSVDKSLYGYLDCNSNNKLLLNILTKSNFLSPLTNKFNVITNKCPTYIAEWQTY